jgi:hypothetical protein
MKKDSSLWMLNVVRVENLAKLALTFADAADLLRRRAALLSGDFAPNVPAMKACEKQTSYKHIIFNGEVKTINFDYHISFLQLHSKVKSQTSEQIGRYCSH